MVLMVLYRDFNLFNLFFENIFNLFTSCWCIFDCHLSPLWCSGSIIFLNCDFSLQFFLFSFFTASMFETASSMNVDSVAENNHFIRHRFHWFCLLLFWRHHSFITGIITTESTKHGRQSTRPISCIYIFGQILHWCSNLIVFVKHVPKIE